MTQIPLRAFCFTHYHEFFICCSGNDHFHFQEKSLCLALQHSPGVDFDHCGKFSYRAAFYLGFYKPFTDAAGIGGHFLTEWVGRIIAEGGQCQRLFGGRENLFQDGLIVQKRMRVCPSETLDGEVMTNKKTHSEGRDEKCHHIWALEIRTGVQRGSPGATSLVP